MESLNNFLNASNNSKINNTLKRKKYILIIILENISIDRSNNNRESGKKNNISLESKVKVLDYIKDTNYSITQAQIHFDNKYSYGSIYKWILNKDKIYEKAQINYSKFTINPGRKPKFEFVEEELLNFINFNIKSKLPITVWSLVRHLNKIDPEQIKDNEHTKYMRIYRFIKKGFTIRSPTHKGRLYSYDSFNIILDWHKSLKNFFSRNFIDNGLIINMDEAPVFFNPEINGVIAKKGAHSVIIKTQNQEKHRCTLLLSITASGKKLRPLIIFKGNYTDYMIKQLNEISFFREGKTYFYINNNAWMTRDVMEIYINKIYREYIYEITGSYDYESLLLIDYASSHLEKECDSLFNNSGIIASYIPKGLTAFCQPLDVSINGPFKKATKIEYIIWNSENTNAFNLKHVSKKDVVNWIVKNWEAPNMMTKEMIVNSFKSTGILLYKDNDGIYEDLEIWKLLKERYVDNEILSDEIIKEEVIENKDDYIDDL